MLKQREDGGDTAVVGTESTAQHQREHDAASGTDQGTAQRDHGRTGHAPTRPLPQEQIALTFVHDDQANFPRSFCTPATPASTMAPVTMPTTRSNSMLNTVPNALACSDSPK